jgi:hypothetical protein
VTLTTTTLAWSVALILLSFIAGSVFRYHALLKDQQGTNAPTHNESSTREDVLVQQRIENALLPQRKRHAQNLVHPALMTLYEEAESVLILGSGMESDAEQDLLVDEIKRYRAIDRIGIVGGSTLSDGICAVDEDEEQSSQDDSRVQRFASIQDVSSKYDVVLWLKPLNDFIVVNAREGTTSLDQEMISEFASMLSDSLLTEDGIVATSIGQAPFMNRHNSDLHRLQTDFLATVAHSDYFEAAHLFEDESSPTTYVHLCMDKSCVEHLVAPDPYMAGVFHDRLRPVKGVAADDYLTTSLLRSKSKMHKSWEVLNCVDEAQCKMYNGLDPFTPNASRDDFEIKQSSIGDFVGRGVFAKVDIPKGAYVMQEKSVNNIAFGLQGTQCIYDLQEMWYEWKHGVDFETGEKDRLPHPVSALTIYMEGYGYDSSIFGDRAANFVDSSISTFMNHGCNGAFNFGPLQYLIDQANNVTYAYGENPLMSEMEADPDRPVGEETEAGPLLDPLYLRRLELFMTSAEGSVRDIKAGEELFTNYIWFDSEENWATNIMELRGQCNGGLAGLVVQVDRSTTE